MANERKCWDCFYRGDVLVNNHDGNVVYRCNLTRKKVYGEDSCGSFVTEEGNTPCYECEYFEFETSDGLFSKKNYCTYKKKRVSPDALSCAFFIQC